MFLNKVIDHLGLSAEPYFIIHVIARRDYISARFFRHFLLAPKKWPKMRCSCTFNPKIYVKASARCVILEASPLRTQLTCSVLILSSIFTD